jgi:uracil phosphoribosyltransferase
MSTPVPNHPNLVVFDHPLIQHKLTIVRDRETGFRAFRALLAQIAGLMVFEVTRTFPSERMEVSTPMERTLGTRISATITVVPVLRAGLGMAEGVLELVPEARMGHIGLFRDETTRQPIQYLSKLPKDLDSGPVILVDPMLATGGSAGKAIAMLKAAGARDIRFLALVASPEGVMRLQREHADVMVYAAALDRELNSDDFIMPGLGDAGDRLYGTG